MDLWFLYEWAVLFNCIWEYLKDSKDVIIALLAVIFTIYIPFLLYFYQEINWKNKFKYLDLYIFHKNVFNLRKIFLAIIFLILILLFWNTSEYSNYYWINIIILITSIFPFLFFINNLFNLYELNENLREEKNSKHIIKVRLNSIKNLELNQENFYIFKDILQNKNLEDYFFTHKFLKLFFEKIKVNFTENNRWLIINALNLYKDLDKNSNVLISFEFENFKQLLEIYKADFHKDEFAVNIQNTIFNIFIQYMDRIGSSSSSIIPTLKIFLKENIKDKKLINYFINDNFHPMIFENTEILQNMRFIRFYVKDIFTMLKENNVKIESFYANEDLIKMFEELSKIPRLFEKDILKSPYYKKLIQEQKQKNNEK